VLGVLNDDRDMATAHDIDVYFNRMGPTGGLLVVVAIGTEVYGATDREPLAALHIAARKAVEGLALRGQAVDPSVIVKRGEAELHARWRSSSNSSRDSSSGSAWWRHLHEEADELNKLQF
jgi:hypothetical protein